MKTKYNFHIYGIRGVNFMKFTEKDALKLSIDNRKIDELTGNENTNFGKLKAIYLKNYETFGDLLLNNLESNEEIDILKFLALLGLTNISKIMPEQREEINNAILNSLKYFRSIEIYKDWFIIDCNGNTPESQILREKLNADDKSGKEIFLKHAILSTSVPYWNYICIDGDDCVDRLLVAMFELYKDSQSKTPKQSQPGFDK